MNPQAKRATRRFAACAPWVCFVDPSLRSVARLRSPRTTQSVVVGGDRGDKSGTGTKQTVGGTTTRGRSPCCCCCGIFWGGPHPCQQLRVPCQASSLVASMRSHVCVYVLYETYCCLVRGEGGELTTHAKHTR